MPLELNLMFESHNYTNLKLDHVDMDIGSGLIFIKRKSCAKFQLNMSKHVEEKREKLKKLFPIIKVRKGT